MLTLDAQRPEDGARCRMCQTSFVKLGSVYVRIHFLCYTALASSCLMLSQAS